MSGEKILYLFLSVLVSLFPSSFLFSLLHSLSRSPFSLSVDENIFSLFNTGFTSSRSVSINYIFS